MSWEFASCSAALRVPELEECHRRPSGAVCALMTAWNAGRDDVPGETPTVAAVPCCSRCRDALVERMDAETVDGVVWVRLRDLPDFFADLMTEFESALSDLRRV